MGIDEEVAPAHTLSMRLSTTSWVVGTIVLIAIGIGVRQVVVNRVHQTAQRKLPASVTAPIASIAATRALTVSVVTFTRR